MTVREPHAAKAEVVMPVSEPVKRKLSYKDMRELEQLPNRIERLEEELAASTEAMSAADFYQRDSALVGADTQRLTMLQAELDAAYVRWAELDR